MSQIESYELLTGFRKPLIEDIITSLDYEPKSKGLDIGCGIGTITQLLAKKLSASGELTGLDYSKEFIQYARHQNERENVDFIQGDINNLKFSDGSFNWIWAMDTVWIGPTKFGCPAQEPEPILSKLHQILKPGGKLYLLFWTSQRFIPGYPLLEAHLNNATSANAPYVETMNPDHHNMMVKKWMKTAGFMNVTGRSFVGDINGPLHENDKTAMASLFEMLWSEASRELSKEDSLLYQDLCSPDSQNFIAHHMEYYGYYTYTLFEGTKE